MIKSRDIKYTVVLWDFSKNTFATIVHPKNSKKTFNQKILLLNEAGSSLFALKKTFEKINALKCDKIILCCYIKSGNAITIDIPDLPKNEFDLAVKSELFNVLPLDSNNLKIFYYGKEKNDQGLIKTAIYNCLKSDWDIIQEELKKTQIKFDYFLWHKRIIEDEFDLAKINEAELKELVADITNQVADLASSNHNFNSSIPKILQPNRFAVLKYFAIAAVFCAFFSNLFFLYQKWDSLNREYSRGKNHIARLQGKINKVNSFLKRNKTQKEALSDLSKIYPGVRKADSLVGFISGKLPRSMWATSLRINKRNVRLKIITIDETNSLLQTLFFENMIEPVNCSSNKIAGTSDISMTITEDFIFKK